MPRKLPENFVRKNVTTACENCKKRKIKCIINNTLKCQNCIKKNINCEFLHVDKPRGPQQRNYFQIRTLEEHLFHLKYCNDMYGEEYNMIKKKEIEKELYNLKK
jgi:Fungal Zn(2)-Cys(6) binuclear cluster domain